MSKADKAKQRAFEAYPVLMCYNDFQMVEEDINKPLREIYQGGYRQAEKDNELTWGDIEKIVDLYDDVYCDFSIDGNGGKINAEEHYQEVLKRFKDFKERKKK